MARLRAAQTSGDIIEALLEALGDEPLARGVRTLMGTDQVIDLWDGPPCPMCGNRSYRATWGKDGPTAAFDRPGEYRLWFDAHDLVDACRRGNRAEANSILQRFIARGKEQRRNPPSWVPQGGATK